jgi:predicted acyltransferase
MSTVPEAAPARAPSAAVARVFSLDALRGFDMFFLFLGDLGFAPVSALAAAPVPLLRAIVEIFCGPLPGSHWFMQQMRHPAWEGFTCWDMIMPLFLFLVGAAMPFAFAKRREEGASFPDLYWRVFRRVLVLWVLGMAIQGHLLDFPLHPIALFSNTLQAIAAGYLVSAVLIFHCPLFVQIVAAALLLIGYWLLMLLVPFGGHDAGTLTADANLARYIEVAVFGQFRDSGDGGMALTYTWLLSSMGFAATTLLGAFAGRVLKAWMAGLLKVVLLILVGGACLGLGYVWSGWCEDWMHETGRLDAGLQILGNMRFPSIKHIWSSSMALWSAGWCYLLLAAFYLILDVIKLRFLGWFFVVVGANSIFAYSVWHLVSFTQIAKGFLGGLSLHAATLQDVWGLPAETWKAIADAIVPFGAVLILWLILLYMYRKHTFVKV